MPSMNDASDDVHKRNRKNTDCRRFRMRHEKTSRDVAYTNFFGKIIVSSHSRTYYDLLSVAMSELTQSEGTHRQQPAFYIPPFILPVETASDRILNSRRTRGNVPERRPAVVPCGKTSVYTYTRELDYCTLTLIGVHRNSRHGVHIVCVYTVTRSGTTPDVVCDGPRRYT